MNGKSVAAFAENWIVWAILIASFAAGSALALWVAGHLNLWWPMTSGMAVAIGLGAMAYAGLIPLERAFRLGVDRRVAAFVGLNATVSWGLSIGWGWILGGWTGGADRSDPEFFDAAAVYLVGLVCFWFTSNSIAQLFNGAIYMWGSLIAGLVAFATAAILA